jgi:hypothetical protein
MGICHLPIFKILLVIRLLEYPIGELEKKKATSPIRDEKAGALFMGLL